KKLSKRIRLTTDASRRSVLNTWHGARRRNGSSELVPVTPSPIDSRGESRLSPSRFLWGALSSRRLRRFKLEHLFRSVTAIAALSTLLIAQDSGPRVLSPAEAIQIAIANNRSLKIAILEVDKSKWQVAEFKTKRLPSISGTVL